MKILVGERQSGKTTKLLEMANNKNGHIIVSSNMESLHLLKYAKENGFDINTPLPLYQFTALTQGEKDSLGDIYIDDAEFILKKMIGANNLKGISIGSETTKVYRGIVE